MVDEEPRAYRPRRALPADPPNDEPTVVLPDDEDAPKPLYRDEVAGPPPAPRSASSADDTAIRRPSATSPTSATDETQILSRARLRARTAAETPNVSRPRRPSTDADATTMLPRTATGARVRRRPDELDDDPRDIDEETPGRGRMALLIGGVAAVVVIGLVVLLLIINLTKPTAAPGSTTPPPGPTTGSSAPPSSTTPSQAPAAILTDASMVTAEQAKQLDTKRTWKVALTQRGLTADSAQPACLGGDAPDGLPAAQQTILRLVSASGTDAPGLLHRAQAYTSPEEAAQAYALTAKSIGGCDMAGGYIERGKSITGVGDQATGVVVEVTTGNKTAFRNLILARTGRVIDIVDLASPKEAASFNRTVDVAAAAVNAQCGTAGGTCAKDPVSKTAPPAIGGDAPGYLTTGDLPPVGSADQTWLANAPETPNADNKFGGCQTVNWAKTEATARAQRTYLLEDGPTAFGLDEVAITAKTEKAAEDLAKKVKDDWQSCPRRQPTATVPTPGAVDGIGARSAEIAGWTAVVSQKSATATTRYRVGVVSVGTKVVFTFLSPTADLDLTDDQFDTVTVRAGQRATQVR